MELSFHNRCTKFCDKYLPNCRNRKILCIALLNVLILTFGGYLWNNQPLYTGEDITELDHIQWLWEVLGGKTVDEELDSALFINVSYDKQLVEHRDTIGDIIGNTYVTDRTKLMQVLRMAQMSNCYKYLILDVRFEKENYQRSDDSLFNQIKSMKRIVVATHKDINTPESFPTDKSALADYYATITATNFERYEYLHKGVSSVPLYAYHDLTGKNMAQHFCITTCDGRICHKSLFLKFPSSHFDKVMANGDMRYYELGHDILGELREDFPVMAKDKIIVIGDFAEDLHDTYIGLKPGPYILYKALRALERGEHYVNWWCQFLFACVYFVITCMLFMRKPLLQHISLIRRSKSRILNFCLTFFGCSMLLTTLNVLLFFNGHVHSVLFPSIYFAALKYLICYRRMKI